MLVGEGEGFATHSTEDPLSAVCHANRGGSHGIVKLTDYLLNTNLNFNTGLAPSKLMVCEIALKMFFFKVSMEEEAYVEAAPLMVSDHIFCY